MVANTEQAHKRWYVYLLCDPDTENPFYIGKGTGDRIDDHERFVDSRWHAMNTEKKSYDSSDTCRRETSS